MAERFDAGVQSLEETRSKIAVWELQRPARASLLSQFGGKYEEELEAVELRLAAERRPIPAPAAAGEFLAV